MKVELKIAAALAAVLFCGATQAQTWPTKPMRAILPFTPGGLADVVIRAVSSEMSKNIAQPMVVENRGGASTLLGAETCAKAAPDGHTICLVAVETTSIAPFVLQQKLIDPRKDFEAITNVFFIKTGLTVNPSLGARNLQEFIALAKAKPGSMNYGSTANNVRLFMNEFNRINGTDIQFINFKGGAEAVTALLSNQVQALFFGIGNQAGFIKSGKMQVLVVDGTARSPLTPDSPSLAEVGYKGRALRGWFGFLAPAGTPKPIVARLHGEIVKVAGQQGFIDKYLTPLALEPILNTPEQFAQFLREDIDKGEALVKEAGLRE